MESLEYMTRNIHEKYTFIKHSAADEAPEMIYKDEYELTELDKQLMLGNATHEFNKLPDDLKYKFLHNVIDALFENGLILKEKDEATTALLTLNGLRVEKNDHLPCTNYNEELEKDCGECDNCLHNIKLKKE